MIRDHAAALVELLDTDPHIPIYDGDSDIPVDEPPIYVVLYVSSPARRSLRLTSSSPKRMVVFSTLCVGTSTNECRAAVEHVHTALIGNRPQVSDRICDPILPPVSPDEITKDDDINPPAYVCTDVWSFNTSPT